LRSHPGPQGRPGLRGVAGGLMASVIPRLTNPAFVRGFFMQNRGEAARSRTMEASAPGHAGTASNQPPEFAPRDLWTTDAPLREAVEREGAAAFCSHLATYGALAGDELYSLGFDANRDRPRLRTHDRFGERIDRVEF